MTENRTSKNANSPTKEPALETAHKTSEAPAYPYCEVCVNLSAQAYQNLSESQLLFLSQPSQHPESRQYKLLRKWVNNG